MRKTLIIILFLLIITDIFSGEVNCERSLKQHPCHGECGNFKDINRNGICDIWEKAHKKSIQKISSKSSSDTILYSTGILDSISLNSVPINPKNDILIVFKKFNLFYIISFLIVLIVFCEFLKRKNNKYRFYHRYLWNWFLFILFFICSVSGIILYLKFFEEVKNIIFEMHLISGFLFFIAGIYHTMERVKCLIHLPKDERPLR